jgi:hypothetical protein
MLGAGGAALAKDFKTAGGMMARFDPAIIRGHDVTVTDNIRTVDR